MKNYRHIKVCHVSCAHPTFDQRIFRKECCSLAKAGYDIHLVVSGKSDEIEGVKIHGIGELPDSRLKRMLFHSKKAYKRACRINADIYHFHDPELIPYAVKMKRYGKKVIFDSHENVIDIFDDKKYIPMFARKLFNPLYKTYIGRMLSKLDMIVTVDSPIKEKIQHYNCNVTIVANYPEIEDYPEPKIKPKEREYIVFAGGITPQWNHLAVIKAAYKSGLNYVLCGRADSEYLEELKSYKEWNIVDYKGVVSHEKAIELLRGALVGVALCDYSNNSNWKRGSLGNTKIFEIMMSGIPIICTEFTSWKAIVNKAQCGFCVDPKDDAALIDKLEWIRNNQEQAKEMGISGRRTVEESYNWTVEEKKLLKMYLQITKCL